ncbi:MAG: ATP-binding protein [Bdellovibrionota bacterium]
MNLLSNSIRNLLDNKITHPEIEIGVAEETEQDFFLFFRDNGTGLESERFEQLTAFAFQGLKSSSREGLGLRLVRRLLERVGGGLQILPSHSSGTSFRIRLPRRERVQEELND